MKNLKQLTLNLCLNDSFSFANFFVGRNQQLVDLLTNLPKEHSVNIVYFWGASGSGKTHLLSALCQLFGEQQLRVIYLPFDDLIDFNLQIFDGLENYDLVCMDNLHLVSGKLEWEEKVFCCFNETISNNKKLVMTATLPPTNLDWSLADLKSRLLGGLVFNLQSLNDTEKIACLKFRARLKGLDLNNNGAHFLLAHYERNPKNLFKVLEVLDQAALVAKRRLTIPFIKETLQT